MPRRAVQSEGYLDMSAVGERAVVSLLGLDSVTFQADTTSATNWSSAVLTVKVSNNRDTWYTLPASVTLSAAGITALISCKGYGYACLEVTTAQSGVAAKITMYGEGDSQGDERVSSMAAGFGIGNTAGGGSGGSGSGSGTPGGGLPAGGGGGES